MMISASMTAYSVAVGAIFVYQKLLDTVQHCVLLLQFACGKNILPVTTASVRPDRLSESTPDSTGRNTLPCWMSFPPCGPQESPLLSLGHL